MPEFVEVDAFDRLLLAALQENAGRTTDALAREIPLSASSIARRIRRLIEAGVIERTVAIVRAERDHLNAVIDVQLDSHALPQVEAFVRTLRDDDRVQLLLELSGPFDLMLVVSTRGMEGFNGFVDGLLGANPAVRRYETRFVKKQRKFSTAVPMD